MGLIIGILVALQATVKSFFKKRYTLRYPQQKLDIDAGYTFDPRSQVANPGLKGRHILYTDKCTGCSLCAIACENIAACIDMVKAVSYTHLTLPTIYSV